MLTAPPLWLENPHQPVGSFLSPSEDSFSGHHPSRLPKKMCIRKGLSCQKRCRVCYRAGVRKETTYCCPKCPGQPGLCSTKCFAKFHGIDLLEEHSETFSPSKPTMAQWLAATAITPNPSTPTARRTSTNTSRFTGPDNCKDEATGSSLIERDDTLVSSWQNLSKDRNAPLLKAESSEDEHFTSAHYT